MYAMNAVRALAAQHSRSSQITAPYGPCTLHLRTWNSSLRSPIAARIVRILPAPQRANSVRCCSSSAAAGSSLSSRFFAPPPDRVLLRLRAPAQLLADALETAEVTAELPEGELLEAFRDVDHSAQWILVRRSLEDRVDSMSEKPLEYEDGWLFGATLEKAPHQLGDKVAARIKHDEHPAFQILRAVPPWRNGRPVPQWFETAVLDLNAGKIGGVMQRSRFLVQRPSGAIPERVAVESDLIVVPRQKAKQAVLWGILGFVGSCILAGLLHCVAWMRGASMDYGRRAWVTLVGWATFVAVFLVPLSILPCIVFSVSQAATGLTVVWLAVLLYGDLFAE